MQQASRISDPTAFLTMGTDRTGYLVEMDETTTIFTNPENKLNRGLRVWPVRLMARGRR